jgi:threonine synthase
MLYRSTRTDATALGFSAALMRGLAPDGGLYVPVAWPSFDTASLEDRGVPGADLPTTAAALLAPFLAGDALAPQLPEIARSAFNFPAPLVSLDEGQRLTVLELFHGPTAAFKDFGARFLAACFRSLRAVSSKPLTILVATSGDTGGAVAAAFHRQPGIEVVVLFPKGQVSPTQERQLTCWGDNVHSLAVRGTFDDCQRLVKEAFADPELRRTRELSSANSINLGRLLPQCVYYAQASLAIWQRTKARASFVIPSGNLGNSAACVWARKIGFPIEHIVLAHNANRTVPDYLESGEWLPRASVPTLASAMDVGNPSNFERLRDLFPDADSFSAALSADSVDDEAIRARIAAGHTTFGQIWCPHTAAAAEAYERLPAEKKAAGPWTIVATAHPAKFREIVEPIIDAEVTMPPSLEALFARPVHFEEIEAHAAALRAALPPVRSR